MKLLGLLLSLLFLIISIAVIIATLATENWSKQNNSNLGLFRCTDCTEFTKDWNFECLAKVSCENGLDSKCSLYKNLYKASYSFMTLEFASLLIGIILLEKVCLIILGFNAGPKVTVIATAVLMSFFHILATILWFSLSEASRNCESGDIYSLCANDGSNLAIANCLIMSLSTTILIVFYLRRPENTLEICETKRFLLIKGQFWLWASLFYFAIGSILMLASLVVEDWVDFNTTHGSLTRCKGCSSTTKWLGWDCLQGTECAINPDSSSCKTFKNLYKASRNFISLQAATIIILCLLIQALTGMIRGRYYGTPYTTYTYAALVIILNLASIAAWFNDSEAKFMSRCDIGKICVRDGPQLAIASNFLILFGVIIFCIMYMRRVVKSQFYSNLAKETIVSKITIFNVTPDNTQFIKEI